MSLIPLALSLGLTLSLGTAASVILSGDMALEFRNSEVPFLDMLLALAEFVLQVFPLKLGPLRS